MSAASAPARPGASLFTAAELARTLGGEVIGDGALALTALDAIEGAGPATLSFVRDARRLAQWRASRCGAALVSRSLLDAEEQAPPLEPGRALIVVQDADLATVSVLQSLACPPEYPRGTHPHATVDPSATVDPTASIGPGARVGAGAVVAARAAVLANAVVGNGAKVGPDSVIQPGAVVQDGCVIGAGVILHPGVVIGADGFGYRPAPDGRGLVKIPHIGNVVIEDGVEIGANTTVDRGKFGSTVIGAGTKIDNLVQIGHNCRIGRSCIICGAVGLAGSVTLGDGVTLAGGVGVADNRVIGSGATVGAGSGVMDDIPARETWVGYPARPARTTMRLVAAIEQLPDLISKVRKMGRSDA